MRRDPAQGLSPSRAGLLDHLRDRQEPTTLAGLTATTGLHANTVREHLDALVRKGLARRFRAAPRGRGRPAWLYEATDTVSAPGSSEYAGLATTLAAAIHRGSRTPWADGVAAGTDWGRELARHRGFRPGADNERARRRVLDLLEDLGFAPQTDQQGSTVRLTQCPLLEAADRYSDVVCGVHLGIVRGALAEHGATSAGTDLRPFAEPGACLLELPVASTPTR
ncbi:transcriptional regulator [Actinomadura sp. 7K507]|nr:transcriptional regulator [Actinomadura sp. 7K507]